MSYAIGFGSGLFVGMVAAGWWFGDTSARLIAHLALRHGFPMPTKRDLARMARTNPVQRKGAA